MLRSLKDTLKPLFCLAPATVTATGAATGVDVADFGSVMFLVATGTEGGNALSSSHKLAITVQDSDVDTDASYANCVDADIYDAEDGANGIAKNLDASADENTIHAVHYRGNKRYVRLKLVETGTVSLPVSIVAVAGNSEFNPPL